MAEKRENLEDMRGSTAVGAAREVNYYEQRQFY